jgi:tetratricopeptide (TPR) repeat protein
MPQLLTYTSYQRCILSLLVVLCTALVTFGQNKQPPTPIYVQTELTSKHLIRGEQTYLKISIQNSNQSFRPSAPQIPNTAVNFSGNRVEIDSKRRITRSFIYSIRPAKSGVYTVPPISFNGSRSRYSGEPLRFEVRDPDQLTKIPSGIAGLDILVGWFPDKTTLYEGEQCPLTLKVYVPSKLRPSSWGLPESEKTNCLAWRFSPPSRNDLGEVTINGTAYISAPFKTTLSGISAGKASFGPTRLSIVSRQRSIDPRRGIRISDVPYNLSLPAIDFDIMPLPAGAPTGYNGAIGQFNIGIECKKASIKDTDTVEVLLRIEGKGNLENIQAPQLKDKGWKLVDSSKLERGSERRLAQGSVTFRQILRPEPTGPSGALPTTISAYSMSVFNPDNQSYYKLSTSPIPINITRTIASSASIEQNNTLSIDPATLRPDQMTDILGFINPLSQERSQTPHDASSFTRQLGPGLRSYWQLIPALICLTLIAIPLMRKVKASQQHVSSQTSRKQALKDIAKADDAATFYRRAGRFIEQRLTLNDELKAILTERDQLCFSLKDDNQSQPAISAQRRQEISNILKRHTTRSIMLLLACITCMTTLATNELQAAQNASNGNYSAPGDVSAKDSTKYRSLNANAPTLDTLNSEAINAIDNGQYQKAIDLYQQAYPTLGQTLDHTLNNTRNNTPADILYNIGNCHYQLDQPGRAALAWRRALAQQSNHLRARKNLRYLELREGASAPKIERWQQQLTTLPLNLYQNLYRASLWILLIVILSLRLIKAQGKAPQPIFQQILITLLFLMPTTAIIGASTCYFFPDTEVHTPFNEQAVCLKKTSIYPEAHRDAQARMTLAPSSLVTVISTRGSWLYVTTADDQSGWVRDTSISQVIQGD